MVVKKRTLYVCVLIIAILGLVTFFAYSSYSEKRNEKLRTQELKETIEREIDREYRRLVDRMDSDAKSAMDYEYSYDFRRREIRGINKMFNGNFYFSTDPYEFAKE